jgi:hypothetical protein
MILRPLPQLSHVERAADRTHFVTVDRRVGAIYRFKPVDLESREADALAAEIERFLVHLKPGVACKLIARAAPVAGVQWETSRSEALKALSWLRHELFLVIETPPRESPLRQLGRAVLRKGASFAAEGAFLSQGYDQEALRRLGAEPVTDERELRAFFPDRGVQVVRSRVGLETPTEQVAVLRVWRQGQHALDVSTLAALREELPAPYEIVVNFSRVSDVRSQVILQRRRGQKAASTDSLSARGLAQTEEALEATLLEGRGLVELEWLLVLKRSSEAALREDIAHARRVLERLGDVLLEVPGATPSWIATFAGSKPHQTFLELDSVAPHYLPVLVRGEAPTESAPPLRALPLHRRDGSLYFFDLFRKGYDGANCLINGRRGKGKSVLANFISSSLLLDPEIKLIKVDVGSSYIKECELHGGRHVQFNLAEPSGLNPLGLLGRTDHAQDAAAIVATFLGTLMLESRESVLSKELHGALERAVLAYAESRPGRATLDAFLAFAPVLPRRTLLERFARGGVFANVLRAEEGQADLTRSRYVYFNFERLTHAADEDFAQAVMAAVIATVNLEVLRAGDARRGDRGRVVFFADETPFFIQRNGRFFKLTTANFRKFGHGTVLIAQTTQDFVLPKEGGGVDTGILVNSPIRFFYQVDDEPGAFRERFGLTEAQLTAIQGLGRSDEFREVFLQDELGGRVLRVGVTPQEYWRVTSSRADNEKLQALMNAVPGLTLEEAIRCLAR